MKYEKYITKIRLKNNQLSEDKSLTIPNESNDVVQVVFSFPNKYGASIVRGDGCYGIELAVLHYDHITYETPITDDVIGHIENQEELETLLSQICNLPEQEETE